MAQNSNCMATFYQTKDMKCVDTVLNTLGKSANNWEKQPASVPYAAVGFFAEIFSDYPQEREHLLSQDVSSPIKSLYLSALMSAGLTEAAKKYAHRNSWNGGEEKLQAGHVTPLKLVRPKSKPAENDLLIGAYNASGNTDYIAAILENYTNAGDEMVSDAFRVSLMTSHFGAALTPQGRPSTMAAAACKKYNCKTNINDWMQLMTLASADWAVQSLATHDDGIRNTYTNFLNKNAHIKQLMIQEKTAFENYATMLAIFSSIKNNQNINSSLQIYEELGSAQDALNATMKK